MFPAEMLSNMVLNYVESSILEASPTPVRMLSERLIPKKRIFPRSARHPIKFTSGAKSQFWSLVDKHQACWLWLGPTAAHGYGNFQFGGLQIMAHRYAWEISNWEISSSRYHVHHLCKTKLCVNPSHLELLSPDEHTKRHPR